MGIASSILSFYYQKAARKFSGDLSNCERTQRDALKRILESLQNSQKWASLSPASSYEELSNQVPVSGYADFANDIEAQKSKSKDILCSSVIRYEPTSGSTYQRKWIPYTQQFLDEINWAAAAWLGDTYRRYPKIRKGKHYWSLSWLPKELRGQMSSDDADLFPFYQRWILKNTMAVPSQISTLSSADAAWWSTLLYLAACKDLTLVSVWSPTFFLRVIEDLQTRWSDVREALQSGQWMHHETDLRNAGLKAPRRKFAGKEFPGVQSLWPDLEILSAWDSSSSSIWAAKLKQFFPKSHFQGKGLWATEGVLSIPFEEKKVLAIQSHFFEFKDLQTEEILPAWKIQKGKDYQPILWASTGLLRYALMDRVRVVDFHQGTPCFEFLGRLQSTDLVGEKIDAAWAQSLFAAHPDWQAWTLVAVRSPAPHYLLFHSSSSDVDIEKSLLDLHHYKVARELGQLQEARSIRVDNVFEVWKRIGKSQIVGQNKVEVLAEANDVT